MRGLAQRSLRESMGPTRKVGLGPRLVHLTPPGPSWPPHFSRPLLTPLPGLSRPLLALPGPSWPLLAPPGFSRPLLAPPDLSGPARLWGPCGALPASMSARECGDGPPQVERTHEA